MKLVRFVGDGDGGLDSRFLHLSHPITDHTLCGETMDSDTDTSGHFEVVEAKSVTCPACVSIVLACRGIRVTMKGETK